jgi:hypothetical protein
MKPLGRSSFVGSRRLPDSDPALQLDRSLRSSHLVTITSDGNAVLGGFIDQGNERRTTTSLNIDFDIEREAA